MSFIARKVFPKYSIPLANFQGHHRVALQSMHALASEVDLVLELRDARAPLSTRNGLLDRALGPKSKLLIYTKNDQSTISSALLEKWHPEIPFIQVDCRSNGDAKRVLAKVREELHKSGVLLPFPPPLGINMLITGMPNVGKSTFLNTLRATGIPQGPEMIKKKKAKAAITGGQAGVTRAISSRIKVLNEPCDVYVYDTPGVFVPKASSTESMLALCIVGAVKPTLVDPVVQADYLLYVLNLQDERDGTPGRSYRKYLPQPTNSIDVLLKAISKKLSRHVDDQNGAAIFWVDRWRQGKEGKLMIDNESPSAYQEWTNEENQRLTAFKMDYASESRRFARRKFV